MKSWLTILLTAVGLVITGASFSVDGQNPESPYQRGIQLQKEHKYKEALTIFSSLLKHDSANVDLLNRVSYLKAFPVYPGASVKEKEAIYKEAVYLAGKAIRIGPPQAISYYHFALALGRLSTTAGMKDKVEYAKNIRMACEKAIQLDPSHPGPYHILARWHREVMMMNVFEKAMVITFFSGELEGASYDLAIKNFKTAIRLDPHNPVHYFELAVTYHERNEKVDTFNAKNWLQKALQVRARNDIDRQVHVKAQKLLRKLGG
jgi:tetratricopeptide (TPR) repeat protein